MSEERTQRSPAELQGADAHLAVAVEAAQLGLWDWDLATDALVWDARSRTVFGLDGVELTGHVSDINRGIDARDQPMVAAALEQALATSGLLEVEFRVVWPDGSVHWVHARGQVLVDTRGEPVRMVGTNADVTAAHQAVHQAAEDAAAMAAMVAIAQALGDAESQDAVLQIVNDRGTSLLDAQGAALALLEPDGQQVRIVGTSYFDAELLAGVQRLPADLPLPLVRTAVTGTPYFLPDLASTTGDFPAAAELYPPARTAGSAAVPLLSRGRVFGSLSVAFAGAHHWRPAERELLHALASLTAQALQRLSARDAERTASAAVARFSETLQRSLLTAPAQPDHLQIAVRYSPAAADAQVGGDWYDAFLTADGATSVVIGDVTGHDQQAAAAMGQLRNLLRGIGHAIGQAPAAVLTALDHAVHDLDVTAMATLVLARVEQDAAHRATGARVLRWSNAGHPPPLLLSPDGSTRYLQSDPDLLIGIDPDTTRCNHTALLHPGDTVLLYTDGLVERRGAPLQTGLDWLADTVAHLGAATLDQLCDRLLAQVGDRVEDDVALLALRAHPQDALRPPEAGPSVDPRRTPTLPTHDRQDRYGEHGGRGR